MVQYRQLQSPAELNTSIPDTGAASAYEQLASTFKNFSNDAFGAAAKIQTQRGAEAGAVAGASGKPGFKGALAATFTAYGAAYNNAAMRSYTIKASADAEDTAARLQVEAGTDAGKFQTTFGAVRDATIKQAPSEARGVLMDIYNQHMGAGLKSVMTARALELRNDARTDLSEGISRSVERVGTLLAKEDPVAAQQAEEEQVKLSMMIDGAQHDGTLSDIEAAALHTNAAHEVTAQTVVSKFQRELDNPYGDPVGFISRFHEYNKTSNALLPKEKAALEERLMSTLRQKNSLESLSAENERRLEAARYEAGDRSFTAEMLAGTLTQPKLLRGVLSQNLKPEIARTLLNELQKPDPGTDDQNVLFSMKTDLLSPAYDEATIAAESRLKKSTRSELILERRRQAEGWQGTQAAREAGERIDRELGIVPGTVIQTLPPEVAKQRQVARTTWYNIVDSTDPAERQGMVIQSAEDVIRSTIRRNKGSEAADLRRFKESYVTSMGNPSGFSPDKLKAYNTKVAKYDADIAAAEAEAARK